jgi:hypothetical protein
MALRPIPATSFWTEVSERAHRSHAALALLLDRGFDLVDHVMIETDDALGGRFYLDLRSPRAERIYLISVQPDQGIILSLHLEAMEEQLEQYPDNATGWWLLAQDLLQRESAPPPTEERL